MTRISGADTGRNDLQHRFLIHQGFHIPGSAYSLEITVAMAAPFTPIWNTKIKIGSSTILITAPMTIDIIAVVDLPWGNDKRIQAKSDLHKHCSQKVNRQIFHSIADGSVAGPEGIKQGFLKNKNTAIRITEKHSSMNTPVPRIFSACFLSFFPSRLKPGEPRRNLQKRKRRRSE